MKSSFANRKLFRSTRHKMKMKLVFYGSLILFIRRAIDKRSSKVNNGTVSSHRKL